MAVSSTSDTALEAETTAEPAQQPRLAIVADYAEEQWPSMDLVADMLFANLRATFTGKIDAELIRPPLKRRFGRLPVGFRRQRHNADRLLGRFYDYPRVIARHRAGRDLFHIVDHSYAHLALGLPAGRTVVTCHDLDAFRCLERPAEGSALLRRMAHETLEGLRHAARVICVSEATRVELIAQGFVAPDRLVVIPNGVHPACTPEPDLRADARAAAAVGARAGQNVEILHVGSTIPRKRIDVLLRAFAGVRRDHPSARLLRVGGDLTADQMRLAAELGIEAAIVTLPRLDPATLAAVYRRSSLLLFPSEREGFGLPVLEALACGLPVVASDIDPHREVADTAAAYAPVGDPDAWSVAASSLLRERAEDSAAWEVRRQRGIDRASTFTWSENAKRTVAVYEEMLG